MNSDAPCESAVRTSLIPHHVRRSWGNCPPQFEKLRVAKLNCPPFGIKLEKKKTCLLRMEAYKCPVTQGYKDNWIMVCIETIVTYKQHAYYRHIHFFVLDIVRTSETTHIL